MDSDKEVASSSTKPVLDSIQKIMDREYSTEHHQKKGPDFTRPRYRDGRKKTSVKAYCIANESQYLLIQSVPTLNLYKELKDRFKQFGRIELLIALPNYPNTAPFTEVYLLKFERIANARYAKRRTDDQSFFGEVLHVCYAPEFESVSECRLKLHDRRVKVRSQIERNKKEQEILSPSKKQSTANDHKTTPQEDDNSVSMSECVDKPPPEIVAPDSTMPYISPVDNYSYPPPTLPSPHFRPYFQPGPRIGWDYAKVRSAEAEIDSQHRQILCHSRQSVPLPVQQALAWRPISPAISGNHASDNPTESESPASSISSSFIPRNVPFDFQPPRLCQSVKHNIRQLTSDNIPKLVPRQVSLKHKQTVLSAQASILGPELGPQMPQSILIEKRKRVADQGPMQSLDWENTAQKIRKITSLK